MAWCTKRCASALNIFCPTPHEEVREKIENLLLAAEQERNGTDETMTKVRSLAAPLLRRLWLGELKSFLGRKYDDVACGPAEQDGFLFGVIFLRLGFWPVTGFFFPIDRPQNQH